MEAEFEHGRRLSRHGDPEAHMIALFGEEFAAYRERWRATTTRETLPDETPAAPLHLSAEVSDACNLNCVFCYRHADSAYGTGKRMPVETFARLLGQARDLGVWALEVGYNGEALTHPDISSLLAVAAGAGFQDRILPTNGLLLKGAVAESVVESVTRVHISIDAASAETYREVRGGDYRLLRRNIDGFLDLRAKRGGDAPILRVSFVVMDKNRGETEAFARQWRDVADIVDFQGYVDFSDLGDIGGDLPAEISYCPDPNRMLVVRANGDIFPCCSFYNRYFPLGTFPETSLADAWTGKDMTRLRAALLSGNPPRSCRKCRNRGEA